MFKVAGLKLYTRENTVWTDKRVYMGIERRKYAVSELNIKFVIGTRLNIYKSFE